MVTLTLSFDFFHYSKRAKYTATKEVTFKEEQLIGRDNIEVQDFRLNGYALQFPLKLNENGEYFVEHIQATETWNKYYYFPWHIWESNKKEYHKWVEDKVNILKKKGFTIK